METFENIFKQRNPDYEFLISRMRCAMDVDEVTYADISNISLRKFKEYMEGEVANSSLKTYMAVVAATINEMADDNLCLRVDFKKLGKLKCEKSENIALSESEIELFVNYYNRIKNQDTLERDVLTLFLLECLTGARNSDCKAFSEQSISDGFLTYVSKKTHTLTKVPVHRLVPLLISKAPKKEYSRTTTCRKIKEIAKHLGISKPERRMYRGELKTRPRYEYIATHTARRTFISLMLDKGVPLATVTKLSGHKDAKMTLRYYCSEEIILNDAAMDFFNK
jgi:integrase